MRTVKMDFVTNKFLSQKCVDFRHDLGIKFDDSQKIMFVQLLVYDDIEMKVYYTNTSLNIVYIVAQ